jgi:hypothetical protein
MHLFSIELIIYTVYHRVRTTCPDLSGELHRGFLTQLLTKKENYHPEGMHNESSGQNQ